jgi:hypothetical protein
MNAKTVISAVMALSLASAGLAYADDHGNGNGNDRGRYEQSRHPGQPGTGRREHSCYPLYNDSIEPAVAP